MSKISTETSFLYAVPSFLGGMAHTLDMGSTLETYNKSNTPAEADTKALHNDWAAVGGDILIGIKKYEQEKARE